MEFAKSWWAVALKAAGASAILVAAILLLPWSYGLLLALVAAVFLLVLAANPALRYWRLVGTMVGLWCTARFVPSLLLKLKWRDDLLIDWWIDQSVPWTFDICVAAIVAYAMRLDWLARREKNGIAEAVGPIQTSIGWNANTAMNGSVMTAAIGNVTGNGNTITQIQQNGPTAEALKLLMEDRHRDFNAEISAAAKELTARKPELARHQLVELKRTSWDRLTPRERYRLIANLGHAAEQTGDTVTAGKYFIDAKAFQPHDADARAWEAWGYYLLDDKAKALSLAVELLQDEPNSSKGQTVKIRCSPKGESLSTLEASIPSTLRGDAEVLFALSTRAASLGDFEAAERLARKASDQKDDDIEARGWLGTTIVLVESRLHERDGCTPNEARLQEAVELLTDSLRVTKGKLATSQVRYGRAEAFALLDRLEDAETDFRLALDLDSTDQDVIRRFALLLHKRGRIDSAIKFLDQSLCRTSPISNRYLFACLCIERGTKADLNTGFETLRVALDPCGESDLSRRAGIVNILVKLLTKQKKYEEAISLLDSLPQDYLSESAARAIRANAYMSNDCRLEAILWAKGAKSALGEATPSEDLTQVAATLMLVEEHRLSLDVWKLVLSKRFNSEHALAAIECARRCEDDLFVLSTCERLRLVNAATPFSTELESVTLERYEEFDRAISLMQTHVGSTPQGALSECFRARLSMLGIRLDRADIIETDPSKLPSVDSTNIELCCGVARILRLGPDPAAGLTYAYKLLRRHFDHSTVRRTFVSVVGVTEDETCDIESPIAVQVGSAVEYAEVGGSGTARWIVIEDCDDPRADRDEFPPANPLVQKLLGLKVGDQFFIRVDPVQERVGRIKSITSKYIYRAANILETWEETFPEEFFVKKYSIARNEDGSQDFSTISRHLEVREQERQRVLAHYRGSQCSVLVLASLTGMSYLETLYLLRGGADVEVRCCLGSAQEVEEAAATLTSVEELVIDSSALATLYLSGTFRFLRCLPFRCLVLDSTLAEYKILLTKLESPINTLGGKVDGRFQLHVDDAEARLATRRKLVDFLAEMGRETRVISAMPLAELARTDRDQLIELLGRPAASAAAASKLPGRALWTDDWGASVLGVEILGIKRVWTQAIFRKLGEAGQVSTADIEDLTLFLLDWKYSFTAVVPSTVLYAGKRSIWEPSVSPLSAAVDWLGKPHLGKINLFQFCAVLLPKIWLEADLVHQREATTHAIIASILQRPDGLELAQRLAKHCELIFRLNIQGAEQCRLAILETIDGARARIRASF